MTFCLWFLFSMGYRVIDTSSSVFSAYLVQLWYPLSFVGHLDFLSLTPLYLHPSCQSLIDIELVYFAILHDLIPFSWSGEDINQSWAFWPSFHMPLDIRFNKCLLDCWCLCDDVLKLIVDMSYLNLLALLDLRVLVNICFVHRFSLVCQHSFYDA